MGFSSQNYSYDSKYKIGNAKFNGDKKSGFSQNYYVSKKENHVSMNYDVDEVEVPIDRF